jgi:hypothetical protein
MRTRIYFGLLCAFLISIGHVRAGGGRSLAGIDDFGPGDTLRYTIDGSTPDRSSPFVLYSSNALFVPWTTTIKARLYRPGFQPSLVQSRTVRVAGTEFYQFTDGWNLVSLPLTITDKRRVVVYPSAASDMYSYSRLSGYVRRDTLKYDTGYLIKFASPTAVALAGGRRLRDTVSISSNWNLIGTISDPLPVSRIIQSPAGILRSPFYAYSDLFTVADTLLPGHGYWVKSGSSGKLILDARTAVEKEGPSLTEILGSTAQLTLTDKSGSSQKIYLTTALRGDVAPDFFELPPAPPSGIFDARLVSERMLEVVQPGVARELEIRISSALYPVAVQWDCRDQDIAAALRVGAHETDMGRMGTASIADDNEKVVLRIGDRLDRPAEFLLEQNYPNPWNPSTSISYSLPRPGFVTLTLFNILGQEVKRLVNQQQQAGRYTVKLQAGGMASGVYFYRLDAGEFSQTKKLLLLQ